MKLLFSPHTYRTVKSFGLQMHLITNLCEPDNFGTSTPLSQCLSRSILE